MNKLLLFLPIFILLISCENAIKGEGDASLAQDYQLDDFDAVEAIGKFKLVLIPNDSSYVSVQTHKNMIDNMDIYVQNKTLKIGEKEQVDSFESYVVYLYFDNQLDEVDIFEKVYLESSNTLRFDELDLKASDESTIKQFALDAKELNIEIQDKAEVEISGIASNVDFKAKDLSRASLEDLDVKVMEVDLSGESEVLANINKEVQGRVLENATLRYIGNPQKDVEVKDNGEIVND